MVASGYGHPSNTCLGRDEAPHLRVWEITNRAGFTDMRLLIPRLLLDNHIVGDLDPFIIGAAHRPPELTIELGLSRIAIAL